MGQVRLTRRARTDLLDIWDHVAALDPGRADDILDRIQAGCHVLRDHPRFGRARPDIGEGARMLVIQQWIALHRTVGDDVQVVRVIDSARPRTARIGRRGTTRGVTMPVRFEYTSSELGAGHGPARPRHDASKFVNVSSLCLNSL